MTGEATRLRVLIVDDEPLARQRIADMLAAEQGIEVVGERDTGAAAIEAVASLKPDLVFLDVQRPSTWRLWTIW
jgi:chemotaxis response regulator CheB